jgi:hypothetical protein
VLLYASQLIKAGVKPHSILDTTPKGAIRRALPHLISALRNLPQLIRGLGYMMTIARARVPVRRGVEAVEVTGADHVETVSYRRKKKWTRAKWYELEADLVLLHEGVVPHTHLAMSLGVKHVWHAAQLCWRPELDADGKSSLPGISITGDGAGIGGWRVAVADGALVAQAMALSLGASAITDQFCTSLRRERALHASLRPFLDALYQPRAALLAPTDDVIICRCEEKTAGDLRVAVAQGCLGPNQVKSFTRCGMGPCQGRACALTLTTLIAKERDIKPEEIGYLRIRPPLKALTLGELAALGELSALGEPEPQNFPANVPSVKTL